MKVSPGQLKEIWVFLDDLLGEFLIALLPDQECVADIMEEQYTYLKTSTTMEIDRVLTADYKGVSVVNYYM
jgi:hypothetical protein